MAKRVAECIIDLLDHDQSDLKEYFKRCRTDWRWLLREDIKTEMRKNRREWGTSYNMKLDIAKYYKCECGLNPYGDRRCYSYNVPNITHSINESDEDRTRIREEIDKVRNDPSMLWNSPYSPLGKITCFKLQQLIDYCKSLGFKITVYHGGSTHGGSKLDIHVKWGDWVDKKGNILI